MGCGVCGVVYGDPHRVPERRVIRAMTDIITHRGPDDSGEFVQPGVALGVRRLAILDLSDRAHMPMSTADGRYTIVYNGEVYNYRELRAGLERRGIGFRSDSDTEVVLQLYATEGPAALHRLNGMFGFAIWDAVTRTLFIARDRLGVKPMFYAVQRDAFYFASEEKALFAGGIPRQFDSSTWEELLCFRFVAGEGTPFTGVRRLLPGHHLTWKDGQVVTREWWRMDEGVAARRQDPPADPAAWFRETFDDAVRLRRISDVPVGVLLSGGIDSGSIAAALAGQAGAGVAGFTVRFSESDYDEGPTAREVARSSALSHYELVEPPGRLPGLLREAAWLNDEPIAHGSDLHLLAIARYAKPRVTVLLSGEGGDELLGGYLRYLPLRYPRLLRAGGALQRWVGTRSAALLGGHRAQKLARLTALGNANRIVLFNSCDVLPSDLAALGVEAGGRFAFREGILDAASALYPDEPFRQAMYLDQHTFLSSLLDRNDRMTMGASIECRTPFLDVRLVEGLGALPTDELLRGGRKGLLRRAVGHRLPEAVLRYRKWGFAVPWGEYLSQIPEFRQLINDLPSLAPIQNGPFDRTALRDATRRFLAGDMRFASLMRSLAMIAVWHEECVAGSTSRSARPVAAVAGAA